jgi:hypothetical protein
VSFLDIAQPLLKRNIPLIPLRPKSKIPLQGFDDWPNHATTDLNQIQKWAELYPDANCGCVSFAKLGGIWIWEVDSPEAIQRCEQETGQKIPKTFRVRSRVGRGHIFFRQTVESMTMGNLSQSYVKGGDWSARVDRQYCVGAGSLHPISGLPYEIVSTAEIIEAPNWLVDWLQSQKVDKIEPEKIVPKLGALIPHGLVHGFLLTESGKLRAAGLEVEEIENILIRKAYESCQQPLDEQKIRQVARSMGKYPIKNNVVIVGGASELEESTIVEEPEERPEIIVPPYPRFPRWVMENTSIYRGLVRPFCEKNSRYEEFLFMPSIALYLNYLGTRVRIEGKEINPSLFMVLIGQKGRVIKSSSVKDAMRYFTFMGLLEHGGPTIRNAEGKILVFTAGSPEGLGIEAQRVNAKNFVLFYDELSVLVNKAGIDSSTLVSNLLTLYEGDKFSNMVKSKKETYSLDPGTYCTSMIACCTDKNFKSLWGKMSGVTSGLNDRMFFLYQPEKLKDVTPPIAVNTMEGAMETRKLIDRAVQKGVYSITDSSPLADRMKGDHPLENRQEIRAEKFALFFAIDEGKDEIDEESIEKGLALVEYEQAVKRKLRPNESITKEAGIQNDIIDFLLTQPGGMATHRDIRRNLHPERWGTSLWGQAFAGLVKAQQIMVQGKGTKTDPKVVVLLQAPEEIED